MKLQGLLKGDFVEFGAGKAGLSSFIAQSAEKESTFLVIEREARRKKKDKDIRACGFPLARETMDIKDFDLTKTALKSVIGVAKHLCGGATDLTLTSFAHSHEQMKGVAIATCCHHACDTKSYVNLNYVENELGISLEKF
jgi:tRNA:m4X modification enzyme